MSLGAKFGEQYWTLNVVTLSLIVLSGSAAVFLAFRNSAQLSEYHAQIKSYANSLTEKTEKDRDDATRYFVPLQKPHHPKLSWIVAFLSFTIDWIIIWSLGTIHDIFDKVFVDKLDTNGNNEIGFIAWTAFNCLMEVFLYLYLWSNWTLLYERQQSVKLIALRILFGLIWGLTQSLIMCSIYRVFRAAFINANFSVLVYRLLVWLCSFITLSAVLPVRDVFIWSKYVTPTHDNLWSMKWKPFCIHIPNSIITLSYLVYYDNIVFYALFNSIALLCAAIGGRLVYAWNEPALHYTERTDKNEE